jgi:hypothetical protein
MNDEMNEWTDAGGNGLFHSNILAFVWRNWLQYGKHVGIINPPVSTETGDLRPNKIC